MDVTAFSVQTLPEESGSPSMRAPNLALSTDAAKFLLELVKLMSAPAPIATKDDTLADEPAEASESGAEPPVGGNVLPLAPPVFDVTLLNTSVAAAASSNATVHNEPDVPPPIVAHFMSMNLASRAAPGAASTPPTEVTDTAAAETLIEPAAGGVLQLATAAAIETPEFQRVVDEAIQQLVAHSAPPLVQVSAPDSSREPAMPLSSLSTSAPGGTASPTGGERAAVFQVSVPLGEPEWDSGVAERVLWMVREQNQAATIRLNPPGLGPLNVTIQVQDGQATVQFHAAHAAVREALDVAVPRLREMLAEAGVSLAGVNVSGQGLAGQGGDFAGDASPFAPRSAHTLAAETTAGDDPAPSVAGRLSTGLIDFYA